MHDIFLTYFSTMKTTKKTVRTRYEIRGPVFHHSIGRQIFAEHSLRLCLINILNNNTRPTTIMGRMDTDPFATLNFT